MASDFYAYVDDNDDITQYSDTGLRNAHTWANRELDELLLEEGGDPLFDRVSAIWERIVAETEKRGVEPFGGTW